MIYFFALSLSATVNSICLTLMKKKNWLVCKFIPYLWKKISCDENTIKTTHEYHILILVENKNWSIHKLPFIKNEVK